MNVEDRIENLKNDMNDLLKKVNILEDEKIFPNRNISSNGKCRLGENYIKTEEVIKAICKKLNIDIYQIDTTPTVKEG